MFLLLLAIADDAGGLVILAVVYPQGELAPAWLLVSVAAATAAWVASKGTILSCSRAMSAAASLSGLPRSIDRVRVSA